MKKLILALIGMIVLAGCNTIAGLGEDTQALGKTVEHSAARHQHYTP